MLALDPALLLFKPHAEAFLTCLNDGQNFHDVVVIAT